MIMIQRRIRYVAMVGVCGLVLVVGLEAQSTNPPNVSQNESGKPSSSNSAVQSLTGEYIIGPDDVLKVSVFDVPEISGEFRVSNDGTVTLPVLAKPLTATGLTLSQLSESVTRELKVAGLVSDPHVSTSIDTSRLHAVAITGAVKKPQIYPVFTQTTLVDVLSQAEGLADDASGSAVVTRGTIGMQVAERKAALSGGAPEQSVTVDVKRVLESGDPKLNVDIYPGDRITVPHAGIVYVVGAVNKPGGFTMRPSAHGLTVLQALALAENPIGTAKRNQTVIIRNDPQAPGGRKQIPVELKKVLAGKKPDPVLEAEDILFVPDSAGKHALHRGIDAIVATSAAVTVYRTR